MKKFVMVVLFVFVLSSVAFASPLMDYSKGKAALDINYRVSPDYDVTPRVDGEVSFQKVSLDGDNNLEWGFTYGIGNKWALQYRQATPKGTKSYDFREDVAAVAAAPGAPILPISEYKTRVDEYNVLYQVDKNVSLFTGIVKANPSCKLLWDDFSYSGEDKNIWQFGVVGSKPLNDNLTAYGLASFGSDYRNWEAGLGYKLSKELELNVNYRDMKVDDLKIIEFKTDAKIKGWGFGVTYNF